MVRSLTAKAGTMGVALLCGVVTTRLIIGGPGAEYFALYSLLVTLPTLVTFTDLGSGAAVVHRAAASGDPSRDAELTATVLAVCRILLGTATTLLLANGLLLLTGGWTAVLGEAGSLPHASVAAAACLLTFSLTVSLGVWQRLLLGLQRQHLVILLQGIQSPVNLLVVAGMLSVGSPLLHSFLGIGSFIAALSVAVLGYTITSRTTRPLLAVVRQRVPRPRQWPGARVMDLGWPMLAQALAAPLSLTIQRYILAQQGTTEDLAQYAVLGQVFFAVQSLVASTGIALWPSYARARAQGSLTRGPYLLALGFAGGVGLVTVVVLLVRQPLFGFITDGKLPVDPMNLVLFGTMIALQAALYPLGMFIMDADGLRFQVLPVFAMITSTILLSLVLTPPLGAAGPLLANAVSVLVLQVVPFSVYIHRHRERLWGPPGPLPDSSGESA